MLYAAVDKQNIEWEQKLILLIALSRDDLREAQRASNQATFQKRRTWVNFLEFRIELRSNIVWSIVKATNTHELHINPT